MIYLDNAATTKIKKEVLEEMMPYLSDEYGNPSGKYELGFTAKDAIENSRRIIVNSLNVRPDEIFFTSGATEGLNYIYRQKALKDIWTGIIEHHAVLNQPDSEIFIKVDKYGFYDLKDLQLLMDKGIKTLVIQFANNEIGTIQPIEKIGKLCRGRGIILVVDATQAYGHINIDCRKLNIDCLVASGHKFGAPKGVGFIYINRKLLPTLSVINYGGDQEQGFRAGTENVAGIVGLGKAASIAINNLDGINKKINERRNQLYGWITNNISGAKINGTVDWRKRLPGNLNFSIRHVRGETLLAFLNDNNIAASTGSACNSSSKEPSHVLKAIGLTDEEANNSIRFTIGEDISKKDIEYVCGVLKKGVEILRY